MRVLALVSLLLVGCGIQSTSSTPSGEAGRTPEEDTFASSLSVDLSAMTRSDTGLYVRVLKEGEGARAAPGDAMGVVYTVWKTDGSMLDSSKGSPPKPLQMVLGKTKLVAGWTEGVTGMRLGEKRQLVVPYQLGYGETGRPPRVPGYATLIFHVELAEHTPAGH